MAEPYSDADLAAWLATYPPVISNTDARWRPTVERLLRERNAAHAAKAELVREVRAWNRTPTTQLVRWPGLEGVLERHEHAAGEVPHG